MKNFEEYQRYLTPDDVCEILKISKPSFYKRAWKGELPITKLGGSLRVDKYKLEKLLDSNTRSIKSCRVMADKI